MQTSRKVPITLLMFLYLSAFPEICGEVVIGVVRIALEEHIILPVLRSGRFMLICIDFLVSI